MPGTPGSDPSRRLPGARLASPYLPFYRRAKQATMSVRNTNDEHTMSTSFQKFHRSS